MDVDVDVEDVTIIVDAIINKNKGLLYKCINSPLLFILNNGCPS